MATLKKKNKLLEPSLQNLLQLFSKKIEEYSGESKRSYKKAFSSFQIFVIGHYNLSHPLEPSVIGNWVVYNLIQGLSSKTVTFYLEKIASLYSSIGHLFIGGKTTVFKDIKAKLKGISGTSEISSLTRKYAKKLRMLRLKCDVGERDSAIIDAIKYFSPRHPSYTKEGINFLWAALALETGILPSTVSSMLATVPRRLEILYLCKSGEEIDPETLEGVRRKMADSLCSEEKKWYAMRLRRKVNFEMMLQRFSEISDKVEIPEIYYPCEEIAKKVGRKLVWTGRPLIREVIFFKSHKSRIYPLFTHIHDMAWCYTHPGVGKANYAAIPTKVMEDFRNALGVLGPGFDVAPAGEMELLPGEEVVILSGDFANSRAQIVESMEDSESGSKVYRVTLLNSSSRWDIGIDARLLKKNKNTADKI